MFSYIIIAQSQPQVTVILYVTEYPLDTQFWEEKQFFFAAWFSWINPVPWGVLLWILSGSVLPDSPNPYPISDEKIYISTHIFRLDL